MGAEFGSSTYCGVGLLGRGSVVVYSLCVSVLCTLGTYINCYRKWDANSENVAFFGIFLFVQYWALDLFIYQSNNNTTTTFLFLVGSYELFFP